MDKILVIVDNGHGAETPGKRSPDGRLREYDWCRKAARRLCGELGRRGVEAVLLVPEDADIALSERCRRARNLGSGRRAVLVSLHCNAAGNGKEWLGASGWSAFVAPEAGVESRRLAALMNAGARRRGLLGNRCTPPCGYWTAPLAICRGVPFAAVLTENMFQDNRSDAAFLMSERGLEEIVRSTPTRYASTMKASSAVWAAALFAAGFAAGYGLRGSGGVAVRPEVRVITLRDTVTVAEPAPVEVRYLKPDTVRLAIVAPTDSAGQDSAYVGLPRSQAVFEGESYRAYVSGYKPRLDSLALFRSTAAVSVVQPEARRERRFSVGLQAGYGITPKGLQPYIGLGISVTLARF